MDATEHLERIDAQRAVELLEKAVAERGEEFVYEQVVPEGRTEAMCVYAYGGQPSCIAGMALSLHGVPLALLEDRDLIDHTVGGLRDNLSPFAFLTADGADVLDIAQEWQDGGKTWGESLAVARDRADELTARECPA